MKLESVSQKIAALFANLRCLVEKIQSIRGMNDILPRDINAWRHIENVAAKTFSSYGYGEIRFPILERTALFKRAIGEVTDIVEKEMYTFDDKGGDSVTLRPEGTASCVRACEQHGMLYNQTQRLWYAGPMFRYERPQKGRLRQFHQIGAEAFGFDDVSIEVEMMLIAKRVFSSLGLIGNVCLQINTIGSAQSRQKYKGVLIEYLEQNIQKLDTESQRRLFTNPLRIFDSKDNGTQEVLRAAPRLMDYLDEKSRERFDTFQEQLSVFGIEFVVNHGLVRGLDYYNDTVFEWVTRDLGSQGAVCAGGRYNGLVETLGGSACSAFGFAMGLERLSMMLEAKSEHDPTNSNVCDIFVVGEGGCVLESLAVAEDIRSKLPNVNVCTNINGGSFKTQFKRADKSGALVAIVVGADELSSGMLAIKDLRKTGEQTVVSKDAVVDQLKRHFNACSSPIGG